MRLVTRERLYRRVFWGWFALTLTTTLAFYAGDRALSELGLAALLVVMSVLWAIRVLRTGGSAAYGPLTLHCVAVGWLLWTALAIIPLEPSVAARISAWSEWGLNLNREAGEATHVPFSSSTATISIDRAASAHELRKLACYYLFFLLTVAHLRRWKDLRTLLTIAVAVAAVEAVVGSAGILSGSSKYLWILPNPVGDNHRHFGTFVNANHAGTFMGVGLMLCIPLALLPLAGRARRTAGRLAEPDPAARYHAARLVVFALAAAALAVGLVLTNSHGAWLATALPLFILLALFAVRHRPARVPLMLAGTMALASAIVAYQFLPQSERALQVNKILYRGHQLASGQPLLRQTIWEGAYAAAAVAPWCGSGPGSFIDAYRPFDLTGKETIINSAHNSYLEVLLERGLVGIALVIVGLGWWVCMFRPRTKSPGSQTVTMRCHSTTRYARNTIRVALGTAVAVVLLHSAVDVPLQIPAIALIFVALVAAAVRMSPGWKPPCRRGRARWFVPWATVIAATVLLASSVQPLLATVYLSRAVSLERRIESGTTRPGGWVMPIAAHRDADWTAALVERASALHALRHSNSRAAAYGLNLRMQASYRPGTNREIFSAMLRDAAEMARSNPFCMEARLAAATAAAHLGQAGAVLTLTHQAQQLDGGHAETHYAAGRALMAAGAYRNGLIAFRDSLNTSARFVYAIADSVRESQLQDEILAMRISRPRSLCWLAINLPQADDQTRKHVTARLELLLDQGNHGLTDAERLYLRGQMALWLQGRPHEAIEYFEQSLALEPLLWIRWHLAQAYRRADRAADAEAELKAIEELRPDYTPPETVRIDDALGPVPDSIGPRSPAEQDLP